MGLFDTKTIVVDKVHEHHDCVGRKFISVSPYMEGHFVQPRFNLTKSYRPANQKTILAMVAPEDRVDVVEYFYPNDPVVNGDYVGNHTSGYDRSPVCKCGSRIISDGIHIFCTNDQCGLTIHARLSRLANSNLLELTTIMNENNREISPISIGAHEWYTKPFSSILNTKMWGEQSSTLEQILLFKKAGEINLATFLVEDLFRSFIDYVNPDLDFNSLPFEPIHMFYGHMHELTQRRNYNLSSQNTLIKEFIWALGIESLNEDVIDRMIQYEMQFGWTDDILIPYGYMLSHPIEMHRELGVHRDEALLISSEFIKRKYEFFDIFSAYASPEGIKDVFSNVDM